MLYSNLLLIIFLTSKALGAPIANWALQQTFAQKAWLQNKLNNKVIVAVIDTGIDKSHPDLKNQLWQNPGEIGLDEKNRDKSTNGIDDDHNGFIDDVNGWSFSDNSNNLYDHHGHGTHVAGIIAAEGKNHLGVKGLCPQAKIMVLKYYDPYTGAKNNLINTIKAIRYAIKMKAQIINYSGGGLVKSPEEEKVIKEAQQKGILFVAAAGNEKANSDLIGYYPAGYQLTNILSVTANDENRQILSSSNYGVESVLLSAPGKEIISTLPKASYGKMTGTSQATAFATGVAALIMSNNPDLKNPERLIKYITHTGVYNKNLVNKSKNPLLLNSYRALVIQDQGVGALGALANNQQKQMEESFTLESEN